MSPHSKAKLPQEENATSESISGPGKVKISEAFKTIPTSQWILAFLFQNSEISDHFLFTALSICKSQSLNGKTIHLTL